ncbi:MAG: glutamine--fructose-6-phosphate transaminase (isomerizing) [Candidatus Omnitrophota bacterium]|nr:MAG: glutamine--fructose-6-phosphate transaminase (isomerizing) [Candidatus Omnitrophota bacterium]
MCGIIGYIGEREAVSIILEGLKRLEYRGYDSAGIGILKEGKLSILKCKGRISYLQTLLEKKQISARIGIGHTRWATHGEPSSRNAHPHSDFSRHIAVVHNGIIENYQELRKQLEKEGVRFTSETDSEIVPNLIKKFYEGDLRKALRKVIKILRGSYALGIISVDEPDKIIAIRNDSPLIIALGKKENFIASDIPAILAYTRKVIYLNNGEIAVVGKDDVEILDKRGRKVAVSPEKVSFNIELAQKKGFKDFMLKEIYEQPSVLSRILSQYVKDNRIDFKTSGISPSLLKSIKEVVIIACGTAFHAGLVGRYLLETFSRLPVWAELGSEFRYRHPVIGKKTLVIAISQSGETADTLAGVREAKRRGARVISICNVLGSSLIRESEAYLYTYAGPEISVASTKAYTAQLTLLYLFSLYLARVKEKISAEQSKKVISYLKKIPQAQRKVLEREAEIKEIARKHLHFGAFLYLGRGVNFPTALEGALKLKELSYIPAEGYAAGEMKHGPIALIDEYRAVVCIANDSPLYEKMFSNIQEIIARRGKIIAIASEGNEQIKRLIKEVIFIPSVEPLLSPLLTVVPLQLLAYYLASLKGYDVDKPRNLAKSVTVE